MSNDPIDQDDIKPAEPMLGGPTSAKAIAGRLWRAYEAGGSEKPDLYDTLGDYLAQLFAEFKEARKIVEQRRAIGDAAATVAKFEAGVRRVEEVMGQIKGFVTLSRETEDRIAGKVDEFVDQGNAAIGSLASQIGPLHQGIIRAEQRLNTIWNTNQAVLDWIVGIFTGEVSVPVDMRVFQADAKGELDWPSITFKLDREQVTRDILDRGRKMYEAHIAHEKAEIDRMKAEQRAGGTVTPMRPRPRNGAGATLIAGMGDLISEKNGEVIELARARQEIAREQLAAMTEAARPPAPVDPLDGKGVDVPVSGHYPDCALSHGGDACDMKCGES